MKGDFEELSIRARRGRLDDFEQRRLKVLLDSSLDAALAYRAGCEFDVEDIKRSGDDALVQRLTRRLLSERAAPARRSRRGLGWKLALAGVLGVAAAAAGPQLVERLKGGALWGYQKAPVAQVSCPVPDPGMARHGGPPRADPLPQVAAPVAASSEAPEEDPPRAVVATGGRPRSVAETPAALFAEANRARRQGRIAEAIEAYHTLQRLHSSAPESHAADIVLGMLYAKQSPNQALTHFSRYLGQGGPLAPEALWGQAQALSDLGRAEKAREVYKSLLDQYPRSTYANAARARLGEPR